MGKFCRKCGSDNEAEAKFCENCGAEFAPRAAAPAVQPVQVNAPSKLPSQLTPVRSLPPKTVAIIATAVVLLLMASGLAWYLTQATALSNTEAKAKIEEKMGMRENAAELVCIDNFPYARSDIRIGGADRPSQQWMNMLVEAGVFEAPVIRNSGDYFSTTQLVYSKKKEANTAIVGNSLCFAEGLEVASITDINEPEKNSEPPKRVVRWQAKLKNPASWTNNELAQKVISNLALLTNGTYEITTPFVYAEKRWQIGTRTLSANASLNPFAALQSQLAIQRKPKPAEQDGFLSKLTSLFAFGEAPGDVAKKFIEAVINGDRQTVLKLCSTKGTGMIGLDAFAAFQLMGVTSVEVLSETVSGETAMVNLKLETTSGLIDAPTPMIKEGGKWKVDVQKIRESLNR